MDRAGLLASRVRIDCIRIHPLAFPDSIQWPRAISSLTVARQRGTYTRFPVFAEQRRRAFQVNFKELSLIESTDRGSGSQLRPYSSRRDYFFQRLMRYRTSDRTKLSRIEVASGK